MSKLTAKILVLGIGNILLQDDGVGPRAVAELQGSGGDDVEFLDGGTLGLQLLPYLDGFEKLIIIDAVDLKQVPGAVFSWHGEEELADVSVPASFHQVGVKELLEAWRLMGHRPEVVFVGVQVAALGWSMELTPPVARALPAVKEAVLQEVRRLGGRVKVTCTN